MNNCEQTSGQSVYQHGISVNQYFKELISDQPLEKWKLPDWFLSYKPLLVANLHDLTIIDEYTIYHDAGKVFCKTIDLNGKVHFPNHAEVSKKAYLDTGGNEIAGQLIGYDMDIHVFTSEQIANRCENDWSIKDACTLLLVALSEIHSNSRLFGGIESISFKQKFKKIDQRGKQICKFYFTESRQ